MTCNVFGGTLNLAQSPLMLYVANLLQLIERHQLSARSYAHNAEVYRFCRG